MNASNSGNIVHAFWDQVWNAHDAEAVENFVGDDFVIVAAGDLITGRENFKKWIEGFWAKINACIWRSSSRSGTPTVAASRPAGC